jgi:hypothetical protein
VNLTWIIWVFTAIVLIAIARKAIEVSGLKPYIIALQEQLKDVMRKKKL